MLLGPYTTKRDGLISYRGNKVFSPINDIRHVIFPDSEIEKRVFQFSSDRLWEKIAKINHRINISTNQYFHDIGALFTLLPLTTRMISSPGAVYGKESITFTSDTSPLTLKWFNLPATAFLSESSQIYLELALVQQGIDHVYCIYNSFRKEQADPTHLSEFHHIEYEGKVDQDQNIRIALGLVGKIIQDLLSNNEVDLAYFLTSAKLNELMDMSIGIQQIPRITFREALDALYSDSNNEKYKRFTMDDNFGVWEEIRLTEIFGNMLAIKNFPLLEVPFYHAVCNDIEEIWNERAVYHSEHLTAVSQESDDQHSSREVVKKSFVAENTDIIWPGYRETIGSGHRVRSKPELEEKAKIFGLPKEDYQPYLQTRELSGYSETSGFGLGWERMLQGLLDMPFIWSVAHFPRGHTSLKP